MSELFDLSIEELKAKKESISSMSELSFKEEMDLIPDLSKRARISLLGGGADSVKRDKESTDYWSKELNSPQPDVVLGELSLGGLFSIKTESELFTEDPTLGYYDETDDDWFMKLLGITSAAGASYWFGKNLPDWLGAPRHRQPMNLDWTGGDKPLREKFFGTPKRGEFNPTLDIKGNVSGEVMKLTASEMGMPADVNDNISNKAREKWIAATSETRRLIEANVRDRIASISP